MSEPFFVKAMKTIEYVGLHEKDAIEAAIAMTAIARAALPQARAAAVVVEAADKYPHDALRSLAGCPICSALAAYRSLTSEETT